MGCQATEDIWIVSVEEFGLISGGFDPGKQTLRDKKNSRADSAGQMICRQLGNGDQICSICKAEEILRLKRNWLNFVVRSEAKQSHMTPDRF